MSTVTEVIMRWSYLVVSFIFRELISSAATVSAGYRISQTRMKNPEGCSDCKCGIPNRSSRIVGGWETQMNEYPWVAGLKINKRYYCGGTLISNLYVITAAHCCFIHSNQPNLVGRVKVILGDHDYSQSNKKHIVQRDIKEVFINPNLKWRNIDSDLALLKLNKIVKFNEYVTPVCLPKPGQDYVNEYAVVTGWGALIENGMESTKLQETMVMIISNQECVNNKYLPKQITPNMMCAVGEGQRDACQGDSGGPLVLSDDDGVMSLIGVVSWGEGCARIDKPGVYVRINRFLDWIYNKTQDSCLCK